MAAGVVEYGQPFESASDRGPRRAALCPADAVGRKFAVAPAPDFLGVGPGQHLDDMIASDTEPALLADAENAGEEFLRGDGAVVGVAR